MTSVYTYIHVCTKLCTWCKTFSTSHCLATFVRIPDSCVLLYSKYSKHRIIISSFHNAFPNFLETQTSYTLASDFAYCHVNNYQSSPTQQSKYVLYAYNYYNTYISLMTCRNQSNSCKQTDITYPFKNLIGSTVEVWEWIINLIQHLKMDVMTYPSWVEDV